MRRPVEIEDDEDREFIRLMVLARSQPRKKGVYSPSLLAECVRKVYLIKKGTKRKKVERVQLSGFFNDGNWRHFKWQFIMWKMHKAGIIELIDTGSICLGTEVPVSNESGDFGGTLDNLIYIPPADVVCTIDWKGMNGAGFNRAIGNGPSLQYIVQSVGYARLANASLKFYRPGSYDPNYPPETQATSERMRIADILIIGENKNGPVHNRKVKSPLGLVEFKISIAENQHYVSDRVKKLRSYDRRKEMPPPECKSTRIQMFKDCPFSGICRAEIERAERRLLRKNKITKKERPKVKFNKDRK